MIDEEKETPEAPAETTEEVGTAGPTEETTETSTV